MKDFVFDESNELEFQYLNLTEKLLLYLHAGKSQSKYWRVGLSRIFVKSAAACEK